MSNEQLNTTTHAKNVILQTEFKILRTANYTITKL